MPRTTIDLQSLLDAGFCRDDVLDGSEILPVSECPNPLLIDSSENLLDGYHRALGMILWAEAQGLDLSTVDAPAVVVPDWIGERLFGLGISDSRAQMYIRHFGRPPAVLTGKGTKRREA